MPIRRLLPFALLALTANLRVGPGEDYRISWVYKRELLPMKVLRKMEGWRLVEDPDGARGWMQARFLTLTRGAIVKGKGTAEMRDGGDAGARLLWKLEPGVTGKLGDCASGWCAFEVGPHKGFVGQNAVWGAGEP
jgi:SH3-like domain-containing protein